MRVRTGHEKLCRALSNLEINEKKNSSVKIILMEKKDVYLCVRLQLDLVILPSQASSQYLPMKGVTQLGSVSPLWVLLYFLKRCNRIFQVWGEGKRMGHGGACEKKPQLNKDTCKGTA